ncbi:helix-turn-helix domain-containing protein [Micromonospora sp. WMMD987]|uniref:winged helix-turn-helix transcriptional regulator n=1 Tax=Micromonospora sp. WMMD987 TaxID=3016089 RepID=UPI002499BE25|nr:helix-turn-helix domain-containing protein [Micromonospora sp. WMMD987]WFE95567.1 helix-turn-helix domain-containing protein [Micromonospora sp. WMMD987]
MRPPLPADMFDELCPSSLNPIRFGDKWAALVIRCLEHGPRRFSELRVPLHRVTATVLTRSLRSLERDGLVRRTVQPPHVEYELTPVGRSLLEPIAVACAWTERHWDALLDARESYDAATGRATGRRVASPSAGSRAWEAAG